MPFDFQAFFTAITGAIGTAYDVVRLPLALLLAGVSGCLMGCTFNMYGEGKAGVGYSSTSEVYAFHKSAEGNKSKAGSSTELSEPVTRWLFPDKDEVEMTEPMPVEAK